MQSERADIVVEARQLAADGVREIILVSKHHSYRRDRGERQGS
jgi:tRNA A37 methylthiotransferase MiaB